MPEIELAKALDEIERLRRDNKHLTEDRDFWRKRHDSVVAELRRHLVAARLARGETADG